MARCEDAVRDRIRKYKITRLLASLRQGDQANNTWIILYNPVKLAGAYIHDFQFFAQGC